MLRRFRGLRLHRGGPRVADQEVERLRVELFDVLVERRMRTVLEDDGLAIRDAGLQRSRKPRRDEQIAAAESGKRRSGDAGQSRLDVVSDHRVRLSKER